MAPNLDGRVAIVTGGAGGIGEAYARGLAGAGASVVLADLNLAGVEAVAAGMRSDGFKAIAVKVDVTSEESAAAMAAAANAEFGRIDILVNNAAMMTDIARNPLAEIPIAAWEQGLRVNVTGILICVQAVLPTMKAQGVGKIINQSSSAAFIPGGLYRISKHAVVSLTAGLATELGPQNINVNAIAPGLIATEAGFKTAGPMGSPQRTARYAAVPHARPDRPPADLVPTLLLLASDEGDFINGQTISVDGGWVMRL